MSLPRSHRQPGTLCLLLLLVIIVATPSSNAQAHDASARKFKLQTGRNEVASPSDVSPMPESATVNTKEVAAPPMEETPSDTDAQNFINATTAGHARGQCWKLPARATLAVFDAQGSDRSFRRPLIFGMNMRDGSDAPVITHVRALRPVCLMPLPFTPDRKNNARQLASVRRPGFSMS